MDLIISNLPTFSQCRSLNSPLKFSEEIMMIEADIVLGTTESTGDAVVPIMAHPPSSRSDLTLEQFIGNISDHNNHVTQGNGTKKGAKLDFKTINALKQSVDIVKDIASKVITFILLHICIIMKGLPRP